jgi:RimJ/RimL family protein N-acetyltransferase
MNLQPTLIGELLLLRPLQENDFEALYSVASDPLIWQQLPQSNRYQRDVYRKVFEEGLASGGALIVLDRKTNQVIGSSRYYELQESSVAIGYTFLARSHWGHTFNREMKKLMVNHALSFVEAVNFHIAEMNVRSQKAVEKLGAELVEKKAKVFSDGAVRMYRTYQIKSCLTDDPPIRQLSVHD